MIFLAYTCYTNENSASTLLYIYSRILLYIWKRHNLCYTWKGHKNDIKNDIQNMAIISTFIRKYQKKETCIWTHIWKYHKLTYIYIYQVLDNTWGLIMWQIRSRKIYNKNDIKLRLVSDVGESYLSTHPKAKYINMHGLTNSRQHW